MGFFSGCMDARNMTSIEEVKCPKCSADIEVFVRDGKTVGDSVCDNCGYTIKENQIIQYGDLVFWFFLTLYTPVLFGII